MGKRREGREVALQLLFHWDLNAQQALSGPELDLFWEFRPAAPECAPLRQICCPV